jgi:hypothetical protein
MYCNNFIFIKIIFLGLISRLVVKNLQGVSCKHFNN